MPEKYSYSEKIKNPSSIGMSARGSMHTLGNDIKGLRAYMDVLIKGNGGRASKVNGPLGDKYFVETIQNCKDVNTEDIVPRSIYVNNVPYGNIPFLTGGGMDTQYNEFRGLIPGIMSSIGNINPLGIITALSSSGTPKCQAVTLETIGNNNNSSYQTRHVTRDDIKNMSACWFPSRTNPINGKRCHESFANLDTNLDKQDKPDNLNMYMCMYIVTIIVLLFCITQMKY